MNRTSSGWQYIALALAVITVGALGVVGVRLLGRETVPVPAPPPVAAGPTPRLTVAPPPPLPVPKQVFYVDAAASDGGDGSRTAPFRAIQAALEKATPGTQIRLAPGVYREELTTVRDGTASDPIVIKGPETGQDRAGRYKATVYGTGRVVSINNSYYRLDGFTVDGQEKLSGTTFPTDIAAMNAFKDRVQSNVEDGRLVYVGADDKARDLTGITLSNMFLSGAGGECVRLRNNAHDNTITGSVVQYCGLYGKGNGEKRAVYHNGEGIYIGTSPNSDDQPMHSDDTSSHNVVTGNIIRTFGSECFDVKENAHDNVFQDNVCVGNTEPQDHDGSNVELRGYANIVRDNEISESAGVSVKITTDSDKYDKGGNTVENNRISGSAVALMIDSAVAQGPMCGNQVSTTTLFDGDDDSPPASFASPCTP